MTSDPTGLSGIAKIYPDAELKGQYGNYTLRVRASDKGVPANVAYEDYIICIQVRKLLSSLK